MGSCGDQAVTGAGAVMGNWGGGGGGARDVMGDKAVTEQLWALCR